MEIKEVTDYNGRIYNEVLKLLPQLGPETKLPSKDHFKKILESDSTHLFVLELENEVIAGILALCIYYIPTGIKVWIEDVVVDEKYRGRDFGKDLLLYAVDFARAEGAGSVELTSRPSRVAANNLYRKLGFKIRETNLYRYTILNKYNN